MGCARDRLRGEIFRDRELMRAPAPIVAALYVQSGGTYYGLDGVDPWDEERDARLYAGPHPVVAHPPCSRWGRYWSGGPSAKTRRRRGDDGGCFAAALRAVQAYGGVIEHPEASSAWIAHQIATPPRVGGWISAGLYSDGWTCCVEQGHYGHRARKATWPYVASAVEPAGLQWGAAEGKVRLDEGCHSTAERASRVGPPPTRMTPREQEATPQPFRDVLISLARSAARG